MTKIETSGIATATESERQLVYDLAKGKPGRQQRKAVALLDPSKPQNQENVVYQTLDEVANKGLENASAEERKLVSDEVMGKGTTQATKSRAQGIIDAQAPGAIAAFSTGGGTAATEGQKNAVKLIASTQKTADGAAATEALLVNEVAHPANGEPDIRALQKTNILALSGSGTAKKEAQAAMEGWAQRSQGTTWDDPNTGHIKTYLMSQYLPKATV